MFEEDVPDPPSRTERFVSFIGRLWCGLFQHDLMLCYEPNKLSQKCVSCGYQTPGWEIDSVKPTQRVFPLNPGDKNV